ncbi:MAG: hypothetical protein AVDCRST_MAG09-2283 [uncultured Sphingomonas sp.]|uniref:Uncharacterized protein n=1 Tax=uncultured Sphingomonas sp. TaxID=158754 RepID=A0A6J4TH58_9SPHN|nr:hypothetical protein [uncultured Sphingomonas sp.]CAA9522376.1 MAG: hypothetical protein AVDCRST_MAG09-2283 [uncultured Sphingomonas sp.]
MRNSLGVVLAMSLAGCGGERGEPGQPVNEPQIVVRSPEQDRLHELDDMGRDIGLKRAILASGLRCRRVTQSGYVQEYRRLSLWTASCDDGRSWAIFVGPDGSAQVRPCKDMQQLGLPGCRINPSPRRPASG